MPLYAMADCEHITTTIPAQNVNKVRVADPEFIYTLSGVSECGTFIDGSKWVSGAQISILGISGNAGPIGADLDPIGTDNQGFFSASYGNYNPDEDITRLLPLSVNTEIPTVLVAAMQRKKPSACGTDGIRKKGCIEAYDFLTFLSEPPPENAIRPSYLKAAPKTIETYEQAIDDSVFPKIEQFSEATSEDYDAIVKRWSHTAEIGGKYSEGGRAFRPHAIVENYASARATQFHADVAMLLANTSVEEARKSALASVFVYSRDIYYAWVNPTTRAWNPEATVRMPSGAGQATNNVSPANIFGALGGTLLDKAILQAMSSDRDSSYQEQRQISPGHDGPIWGDSCQGNHTDDLRRYWSGVSSSSCSDNYDMQCNANDLEGKRTCRDPHGFIDGPERANYGASYIGVTAGPFRDWCTITRAVPTINTLFNYDNLCIYVDRILEAGYKTTPDLCAGPEADQHGVASPFFILNWDKPVKGPGGWQAQACRKQQDPEACMEKTTFGETWGPVHGDLKKCIAGTGRFTKVNGAKIPILNGARVWGDVYEFFRDSASQDLNVKPEVDITYPAEGQAFFEGDLVDIVADATDFDGSIASVAFFIDNTPLGEATTSPYSIKFNAGAPGDCIIRAIAIDTDGGINMAVRTITVSEPIVYRTPDNPTGTVVDGLNFDYFEIPTMTSVEQLVGDAAKKGHYEVPSITPRDRDQDYGFVFSGYINVANDGIYTFYTTSNDGSDLFIGDTKIVDNDGNHAAKEESGSIALQAGLHKITIRYFQRGGSAAFSTAWAGDNFAKQAIPASAFSRETSE
ncbi:hypothetical protein CBF23_001615 [Marinomonas agarivorans]|nr:hypothetical protein CBF23_001615 [Marinomonas agarivorans]